jgi:hypothetical protein
MISQIVPHAGSPKTDLYQLKVVLIGSDPAIWRRVLIPKDGTLGWLHAVLQVTMGWTNSHLHHFFIGKTRYSDPQFDDDVAFGDKPDADEAKATLAQVLSDKPGNRFLYEYDFGDSWQHEITVEKLLPAGAVAAKVATCLDGARACPPEDCGGVWGYANLLKALKNRRHPEHKTMREWIGGGWDAETFDAAKVNHWLKKLKWPRVTEAQLRKVLMGRDGYKE